MCKRILMVFFIFGGAFGASAQAVMSLSSVDAATYELWRTASWDELIQTGKTALDQGIDYSYLRFRMGIAWYEKGNYHKAVTHLEKAYETNSEEVLLMEYLYYAYLLSGRGSEAAILAATFPKALQEKTGTDGARPITRLDLVYNANFAEDAPYTDNYPTQPIPPINGSQLISKGHQYYYLGLRHDPAPAFSIYHAYSGLSKQQFIYTQEEGVASTDLNFTSRLHQYYLSGQVRVAKHLNLLAGVHFVHIRYPEELVVVRPGRPFVSTVIVTENDYVLFAGITKRMSHLTLGGTFYYSTLNGTQQYQKELKLALYPLGNTSLYWLGALSHQTVTAPERVAQNRIVTDQQLGLRLSKRLWIEAYATLGNMKDFILNDGAVLFNGLEVIRQRYGGRLLIYPSRQWSLVIDYAHFRSESSFEPASPENGVYNTIQYTHRSITGGLSWNF